MSEPINIPDHLSYEPITARPIHSVTPFTYRDGFTYLHILEDIQDIITKTLIPRFNDLSDDYKKYVAEVNDRLTNLIREFNTSLANLDPTRVQDMIGTMTPRLKQIDSDIARIISITSEIGHDDTGTTLYGEKIGERVAIRCRITDAPIEAGQAVTVVASSDQSLPRAIAYSNGRVSGIAENSGGIGDVIRVVISGIAVVQGLPKYPANTIVYADNKGFLTDIENMYYIGRIIMVQNNAFSIAINPELNTEIIQKNMDSQLSSMLETVRMDMDRLRSVTSQDTDSKIVNLRADFNRTLLDYDNEGSDWKTVRAGTEPVQYRIENGICFWRGRFVVNASADSWVEVFNIPSEAMPDGDTVMQVFAGDTATWGITGAFYASYGNAQVYFEKAFNAHIRISGCYPLVRKTKTPKSFSVLQLNIWNRASHISSGIQAVADTITQTDADTVLLCETSTATNTSIVNILKKQDPKWDFVGDAQAILSRFPLSSPTYIGDYATISTISVGRWRFRFASVHVEPKWYAAYLPRGYGHVGPTGILSEYGGGKLPDPITDIGVIAQVNRNSGRMNAIKTVVDAIADSPFGTIIGGDFNEPSCDDWTDSTKDLFERHGVVYGWDATATLTDSGFVDGYRSTHPDPATAPGITWPSDVPTLDPTAITEITGIDSRDRIDFIFHMKNNVFRLESAHIVGPRGAISHDQRDYSQTADDYQPISVDWPTDHKGNLQKFVMK